MTEFPPQHPEPGPESMPVLPERSEVMLRNRDVQALMRSFRRMTEVQEALLEHLDGIEESRRRRWVMPLFAVGSLVLGAGLATFGLLWYQDQQGPLEVRMDQPATPPPEITVQAPEVTVQAPENGIDAAFLEELVGRMEQLSVTRAEDRRLIAELNSRVVDRELELMRALREMEAGTFQAEPANASTDDPALDDGLNTGLAERGALDLPGGDETSDPTTPATEEFDPTAAPTALSESEEAEVWLGALNGLISLGGHPEFRFRRGSRVEGASELHDVLFLIWGDDGLIDSVLRAERAEFRLQRSAASVEIRFLDGTRTRGSARTPIAGGGLRVILPEVDVRAWQEHFPELAETSASGVIAGPDTPAVAEATGEGSETNPGTETGDPGSGAEESTEVDAPVTDEGDANQPPDAPAAWAEERVEAMRASLDTLLREPRPSGHYQLQRVESVVGEELQGVRLAWFDASGKLFQYVEADRLQVHARGDGWYELQFRDGVFRRGDKATPFQGGLYRLHLSSQDPAAWEATGVPVHRAQS